jgi:hypothetical protein|tara:strand:- start:20687 stop:21247 length:561 start_codon:yes stop_codon:yes gene_type:complete
MDPLPFAPREQGTFTTYIQYKGVWDMQDLYEFAASFFSRQKFKFYEKKYIQKSPGPFGPETYYVWEATRDVEEYYRFVLNLFLHTYDTQDVEVVMKDGSKRTFTKGRIWIQFTGRVEMDYDKRWEENVFYANLRNFYHKYVIWKKIEGIWWDQLYYKIFLKLHSLVKERLKMESEGYEHRVFAGVR